jgi:PglZ domain
MKESVLLTQIEKVRPRREAGQAIGVHSQSRWQGRDQILVGQEPWRVAQCDSVLELRQRLAEETDTPLVLVTSLPTAEIGDDVRARLFKQQLLPVDSWNALAEKFKARQVDPALKQSSALADAALDALGDSDAPVVPSGMLTAEAVWQVVLQQRLGLSPARPDLLDFLPWVASEGAAAKWRSLGPDLQKQLSAWLSLTLGDLGPILIHSLADGFAPDAISVGLALGALAGSRSDSKVMGRLEERFIGDQVWTSTLAQHWNQAAERWAIRQAGLDETDSVRRELGRADQILESLGAAEFAIESRWSPLGFQQRLLAFAEQLAAGDAEKSQAAYSLVSSHEGSRYLEELRGRRDRAEMAIRLNRWLQRDAGLAPTLEQAVLAYEQDGSWVDWARHRLIVGDEPEGVSRSYRKLFEKVTSRREGENRRFGELLAASTLSNQTPGDVLPIENVLSKIVAPLAKLKDASVLFIVMDGMSLPVWRELSLDLTRHGWSDWVPEQGTPFRSVLTVLPSATSFSRASLLCGALMTGAQNVEKRGFQDHADLRAVSKSGASPILFHKDEIGASGNDLAESVRLEIRNPNRKIVGVVVNVVDDSLGGPEQLSIQWSLRSISVLQALLSEARDAGRIVILASDHGHVLDHGSKLSRKAECADRWRIADAETTIAGDELLAKGARVLVEGAQIVCPTSETLRYTSNRRLGYHGGLTPQECVAPIAVLAPALMDIAGWEVRPADPPDWWFDDAATPPVERPKTRKGLTPKAKPSARPQLPLFEGPSYQAHWIDGLLASEVFADQMGTFGGRLKREQIEQSLRVLADRNLVLLKSAFAQRIGMSGLRVDGLIASLQRILNVESYPVLSVDSSQTIRLNLQLLREQFRLGDTGGR